MLASAMMDPSDCEGGVQDKQDLTEVSHDQWTD
jgi:hypothetical protein